MKGYEFIDNKGTFKLEDPDLYSYLYFPDGSDSGMMGSLTPELGGDLKTSQNSFILEPVSSDNLHNNRSARNFWLCLKDGSLISATGASALSHAKRFTPQKDKVTLYGGLLWQKVVREINGTDIKTDVTTFVPVETSDKIELTSVKITNTGSSPVTFTPTAATPIYGRSADNIRDHRNVTSMLNRMSVTEYGITNDPTLTFDERGHRKNKEAVLSTTRDSPLREPPHRSPATGLTVSRPWAPRCSRRRHWHPEKVRNTFSRSR